MSSQNRAPVDLPGTWRSPQFAEGSPPGHSVVRAIRRTSPTQSQDVRRRWMKKGETTLSGVVLDDERLVEVDVDILPSRSVRDATAQRIRVELEPPRHGLTGKGLRNRLEVLVRATRRVDGHSVAHLYLGRGNICAPS